MHNGELSSKLLDESGFVFNDRAGAYVKTIFSKTTKNESGNFILLGNIFIDETGVDCMSIGWPDSIELESEFNEQCVNELEAIGISDGSN